MPDLVREIRSKYGFLEVPKDQDLVQSTPPKGAEFKHGKLVLEGRVIVIDKLTVFNDGLVADAASSTDDTDAFLADLIQWAKANVPKAMPTGPRFYLSQIEIQMRPLEEYVPAFRGIGEHITFLLAGYGIKTDRYQASALNLHFDPIGKINPAPGVFYIDRRLNVPYSENVWFSQAPLKTADHIELLKQLE